MMASKSALKPRGLHTVLGSSKVILTNAILNGNWEEVTLYSSSVVKAEIIIGRIKKLHKTLKIKGDFPNIKYIEIPNLDENKSIFEMFIDLNQTLINQPKAGTEDVLLFNGTVPHLIQMIKSLNFQSVLVLEDGELKIKGLFDESWEMLSLTVSNYLILHGLTYFAPKKTFLTEDGEEICCPYLEKITRESSDYGKIRFYWSPLPSSGQRKSFMLSIEKLRKYLGTQAMKHTIKDELMDKWLKNIELPENWGEEE